MAWSPYQIWPYTNLSDINITIRLLSVGVKITNFIVNYHLTTLHYKLYWLIKFILVKDFVGWNEKCHKVINIDHLLLNSYFNLASFIISQFWISSQSYICSTNTVDSLLFGFVLFELRTERGIWLAHSHILLTSPLKPSIHNLKSNLQFHCYC